MSMSDTLGDMLTELEMDKQQQKEWVDAPVKIQKKRFRSSKREDISEISEKEIRPGINFRNWVKILWWKTCYKWNKKYLQEEGSIQV